MASEKALAECARLVRRHDYDRYLCALFAPAPARGRLIALYALAHELARVRETVSEPLLGEIRLQGWRETLEDACAGTPPSHPVAEALVATGAARALSREGLARLVDSRARDLDDTPPADRAALESYAEGTGATLIGLALDALDVEDTAARRAGREVGTAWALTGLVRSVAFHAAQGRCLLPGDAMRARGLSLVDVLAGRGGAALGAVVAEVAGWARGHLEAARAEPVPRAALPALLPASLADAYLARLARARHDPSAPSLEIAPLPKLLRVAWRRILGTI
jgi:phytoene synthase